MPSPVWSSATIVSVPSLVELHLLTVRCLSATTPSAGTQALDPMGHTGGRWESRTPCPCRHHRVSNPCRLHSQFYLPVGRPEGRPVESICDAARVVASCGLAGLGDPRRRRPCGSGSPGHGRCSCRPASPLAYLTPLVPLVFASPQLLVGLSPLHALAPLVLVGLAEDAAGPCVLTTLPLVMCHLRSCLPA